MESTWHNRVRKKGICQSLFQVIYRIKNPRDLKLAKASAVNDCGYTPSSREEFTVAIAL